MIKVQNLDAIDAAVLIESAVTASDNLSVRQCIAVVDAAGFLLAFLRMDGAKPPTADFAIAKARTAAGLQVKTSELASVAQPGARGFGINTLLGGEFTIVGGGVPVILDDRVVGAIGISSGSVDQDIQIAETAMEKFVQSLPSSRIP